MDKPFYLKQFALHQGNTAQRVGTDALLLGVWPFVHTLPEKAHILDVGAGTGIVSLMMAQRFSDAEVEAWEVEDGALKDAATNFATSPLLIVSAFSHKTTCMPSRRTGIPLI